MTREEAIKEIKTWDFLDNDEKKVLETLIPELTESEDERIRKDIISYIKAIANNENISPDSKKECKTWIAWLEKQVSPQMVADAYLRGCNDTEKKWLEKQEQSTTITIPKDLKGTDTDGGVVGEKGKQGGQPTEEEMVGIGELGKVWSEQAIINRLDKIIELLQSAILPISRSPWKVTAITEGGEE